jgi:cobalt-zinc-cadmium resistance protein CzcA
MIGRYLRFQWENRYTVAVLAVVLLLAGWVAFERLPQSIFPPVDFPKVSVLVHTNDLPVRYMLLAVTEPLEQAAKGEPGVTLVRSQTGVGLSKLHVYFSSSTNPETAYLLLQARLAHIPLPPGASISVRLMRPNIYPLAQYALVSNTVSSAAMKPVFAFTLRPAILGVRGVYQAKDTGRGWPEVHVTLSPRRLAEYHLSAAQVVGALRAYQGPFFSGMLHAFHQQFIAATTPRPGDAAALARLPLPLGPMTVRGARTALPLAALGSVRMGSPPLIRAAAVPGYRHAVLVDVSAQQGANQVAVAARVRARLRTVARHLPAHVHLVRIYDLSRLIRSSLRDVWIALGLGSLIAFGVVYLFLGRIDGAVATMVVVPLAVAATMILLKVLGMGINIMTLGGITAAIGALVDHAIVIVERGVHGLAGDLGQRREAALRKVADILPLMTLATLTSCVIFVPLIFLSGTIGLLFRGMAAAVVIALVTSQLVALLITPSLAMWVAQRPRRVHRLPGEQWVRHKYGRALLRGMRKPMWAAPVAGGLLLVAAIAVLWLPTAFLPHWDEGIFVVPYRTPVGTGVRATTEVGREMMRIALRNPAVARASLVVGRGLGNPYATPNKGGITILLKRQRRASIGQVMQQLQQRFRAAFPDLTTLETQQVMINRLGNLSGSHAPLVVELFGKSSRVLHDTGERLLAALLASHAFQSVVFKAPSAGPEVQVTPNSLAAIQGLTPASLAGQLVTRHWGERAGFLLRGEQIVPIRVEEAHAPDRTPVNYADTRIRLPNGRIAPLSQVAHVHLQGVVPYVTHQNLVPYATIKLSPVPGEGLSVAAGRADRVIAKAGLPPGVTSQIGGYYREQQQSFRQMLLILGAALVILLVLLGYQFGSQKAAIVAIVSIALTAAGTLLALLASGSDLDSTAFLGMLLVFAIAVNNVILIFSRAHQLDGGVPRPASVALAAHQRLRPILMTMLADVLGFLPIALGIGRGTDLLRPLAIAVMGGLVVGTAMTLWLAPVLYAAWWRAPSTGRSVPVRLTPT